MTSAIPWSEVIEKVQSCVRTHNSRREKVERMTGIEPALPAWEAGVLPLNYIRAPGHVAKLRERYRQY